MFRVIFALWVKIVCLAEYLTPFQSFVCFFLFFYFAFLCLPQLQSVRYTYLLELGASEPHTETHVTCLLSGDKNSLYFSVGHLRLCCGANAAVIEVMHYNLYWLLNLSEGIKFFFF